MNVTIDAAKKQEAFWNLHGDCLAIARKDFDRKYDEGDYVGAFCCLASAYYSMRLHFPWTFLSRAKDMARKALRYAGSVHRLSVNQCVTLAPIMLSCWPSAKDRELAGQLADRGLELCDAAESVASHNRALLHLTKAKYLFLSGDTRGAYKVCGKRVEALLSEIVGEEKDEEKRLHFQRQKVRVLKGLGEMYTRLGSYMLGMTFLHWAQQLAREVSRDQSRKIRILTFWLILRYYWRR